MEWDPYDISLTVFLFGFCFCSRVFIWATITNFFHYSLRLLPSPNPNPTVLDKLTLLYPIGRRAFESQPKKSKTERLKRVPPMAPSRNGLWCSRTKMSGIQGANSKVRGKYDAHPWETNTNPSHLMVAESSWKDFTKAMFLNFPFKVTNSSSMSNFKTK